MSDTCLCARCASIGKTCCQEREIYVSPGDLERIGRLVPGTDWFEFAAPRDPSYLDQDDDPVWLQSVFRPDRTRRVLKRTGTGDCPFLGACGCRLDVETRPVVCRLYPFAYTFDGIREELASDCPPQLLGPGQDLLCELAMTRADARRWHRMLYDEIRREQHACSLV